jgi:hypothetical protein
MTHTTTAILHFHSDSNSRDADGGHGNYVAHFGWGDATGREAWADRVHDEIRWFDAMEPGQYMRRYTDAHGVAHFEVGGPTDEGFRHTHLYTCDDSQCEEPRNRHRVYDQFAEAAGY